MGIRVRRRWALGGVAVAAVAVGSVGAYAFAGGESPEKAKTGTAKVDRGEVATAVATIGSLEPAQNRSLSFATSGTVTKVNVRPGDEVRAGEVLAEIDPTDAQEQVDAAEEDLEEAQEDLDEAESSGSSAATCPVAASSGPSIRLVAGSGGPTPSRTPATASTPTPSTSAAPAKTAPASPPVPAPSRSSTGRPPSGPTPGGGSSDNCAANQGPGGGGDPILTARQRVISAEQALAEAEDQLAGTKITAPIGGKVLSVDGSVGSDVDGGAAFVTLADVAGMQVSARFPEADASVVELGQAGTVTLANRPGEESPVRVVQIDPIGAADGDMVTYGVVLAFETVPGDLLVGQSANVKIKTSSVADVLRVPSNAIRDTGVVVVRTASGDEQRSVETGLRSDQYTEIKSGLAEGDEVLLANS
jgi:multidrug efflux pump subunit AcrA (membrane-fusion protein)